MQHAAQEGLPLAAPSSFPDPTEEAVRALSSEAGRMGRACS